MKLLHCSLLLVFVLLISCSYDPTDKAIDFVSKEYLKNKLDNIKNKNFTGVSISDISGFKDIRFQSAEKIQCIPETSKSKIFTCDVLIKYEVISENNSISNLFGFVGNQSEMVKFRIFESKDGWRLLN